MVTILSSDFQKIIRDLNTFGEEVEIQFTKDELVFRCKGDFAEQETIINIDDGGEDAAQASEIVQGIFNLKNLILFTKCTSLCTHIKLHLRNDYPIIVEYNVAGLGEIKLALAPKTGGGKS
jgi:proliferating cell nuclear antigen